MREIDNNIKEFLSYEGWSSLELGAIVSILLENGIGDSTELQRRFEDNSILTVKGLGTVRLNKLRTSFLRPRSNTITPIKYSNKFLVNLSRKEYLESKKAIVADNIDRAQRKIFRAAEVLSKSKDLSINTSDFWPCAIDTLDEILKAQKELKKYYEYLEELEEE